MQAVAAPIAQPFFGSEPSLENARGQVEGVGGEQTGATGPTPGLCTPPSLLEPPSAPGNTSNTKMQATPTQEPKKSVVGAVPQIPTRAQASAPPAGQDEFSDYEDDDEDIDPNAPPVVFGEMDLGDMLPSEVDPIRTKADALGLDNSQSASHSSRFRSATPGAKHKSRMAFTPQLSSPFNNLRLSTPDPSSTRQRSLSQGTSLGPKYDGGRSAPAHCPFCDRRYAREIDMQRHVETSCQVAAKSILAEQESLGGSSLGLSQGWKYTLQVHVCEVDALSRHLWNQHRRRLPRPDRTRTRSMSQIGSESQPSNAGGSGSSHDGIEGAVKQEADVEMSLGDTQAASHGEGKGDSSSELTDLDYYSSGDEAKKDTRTVESSPDTPLAEITENSASRNIRKRKLSVAGAEESTLPGQGPLDDAIRAANLEDANKPASGLDGSTSSRPGGKRQKKTRFWTYSKSPEPQPRPPRTPSPMEADTTPGPSSQTTPSGATTSGVVRGPDAAAREAILRADSLAIIVDPYHVKCRRCATNIKLSDKYPYMLRMWERHKQTRGCLAGTGRTAPMPRKSGPGRGDGASGAGGGDAADGGAAGTSGMNGQSSGGMSLSNLGANGQTGGGALDAGVYQHRAAIFTPQSPAKPLNLRPISPSPPPSQSDMEIEEEERKPILVDGVAIPPSMRFDKGHPLTLFSQRMPAVDWFERNEAHARELGIWIEEPPVSGASDESRASAATHERPLTPGNVSDSSGDVPLHQQTKKAARSHGGRPTKASTIGRPVYLLSTDAREESIPVEWEVGMSGRKRKRRVSATSMTDPDEGYVSWATESEADSDYKSGKAKSARPKGHSAPKPKPKPKAQASPRKRTRTTKHQTPAGTFRRGRPPKHEQPIPSTSAFAGLEELPDELKIEPAELAPPMTDTRCPHCNTKFGRPADVRRHVAYICPALQGRRSLKDCTCSRCGAVMARPDALERHHKSAFDCVDGTPRTVWPMGRPEQRSFPKLTTGTRRRRR
ncbi:hypothetical protein EV122DRAFT_265974 [Schizophyllum commune]